MPFQFQPEQGNTILIFGWRMFNRPIDSISVSQDELDLLGLFERDLAELSNSSLIREGPRTISASGSLSNVNSPPKLATAVTDEEIRSYITIFRRLYMEREPANFRKTCDLVSNKIHMHPCGDWLSGAKEQFEQRLNSSANKPPFVSGVSFSRKRLVDIFLYTQYAHQPDERRKRQYLDCLEQMSQREEMLTWMFLTEIWGLGIEIICAGRFMCGWTRQYCQFHSVSPSIIDSVSSNSYGIGELETTDARMSRTFEEKALKVAESIWNSEGKPQGGPHVFMDEARRKVARLLAGDSNSME